MRKISGELVSTKPLSLSRAAKLISRFAAVDNGSSPNVSAYLERAADAFNHLLQFHERRSCKNATAQELFQTSQTDNGLDREELNDSGTRENSGETIDEEAADAESAPARGEEEEEEEERGGKKKKRRRTDEVESRERKRVKTAES